MGESENKARTTITLDPAVWERGKEVALKTSPRKISFSYLVEKALLFYFENSGDK